MSAGVDSGQESWAWPRRPPPLTLRRRVSCLNALKVHPVTPVWHSSLTSTLPLFRSSCCKQAAINCPSLMPPHTGTPCSHPEPPALARPSSPFYPFKPSPAQPPPQNPYPPPAHSVLCLPDSRGCSLLLSLFRAWSRAA